MQTRIFYILFYLILIILLTFCGTDRKDSEVFVKIKMLDSLSSEMIKTEKFPKALTYAVQTYKLKEMFCPDNYNGLADSYVLLASIYKLVDNRPMSEIYTGKALQLILNNKINDNILVARIFNNAGNNYRDGGKIKQALIFHRKAYILIMKNKNPDVLQYSVVANNLGNDFMISNKYDSAFFYYKNALKFLLLKVKRFSRELAASYFNIGNFYLKFGDNDKAYEYYKKALILNVACKSRLDETNCYSGIGKVYQAKGQYNLAFDYFKKSLYTRLEILGETHSISTQSYLQIGQLYLEENKTFNALEIFKKVLEIQKRKYGETNSNLAETYFYLSKVCFQSGMNEMAIRYLVKSLRIMQKSGMDNENLQISVYQTLGQVYEISGNEMPALENYNKALQMIQKTYGSQSANMATILNKIAGFSLIRGQYEEAIHQFKKAILANFRITNLYNLERTPELLDFISKNNAYDNTVLIESLFSMAIAYEYLNKNSDNNLKMALNLYQIMDTLINKCVSTSVSQKDQMILADKAENIYEKALSVCYKLYENSSNQLYIHDAFRFSEACKANILLKSMISSKAMKLSGIPDSIISQENSLLQEKRMNAENIYESFNENKINSTNKLFNINRKYEDLVKYIEWKYPDYYSLKYYNHLPGIQETLKKLPDSAIMISYFPGKKNLYILVLSKKGMGFYALDGGKNLELPVRSYYMSICNYNFKEYFLNDKILYNILIKPAERFLVNAKQIIFVPQDYLLYVPFETLFISDNTSENNFKNINFLVKNFDISYQYSATLWMISGEGKKIATNKNLSFLGIAPGFLHDDFKYPILADSMQLCDLPYSIDEVKKIQKLFKEKNCNSEIYIQKNATKQNFLQVFNRFNIIHIATHGYSYNEYPELTFLAFAPQHKKNTIKNFLFRNQINSDNSWIMRSGEMYNLGMKADLLVLSACETGFGDLQTGEGVMSMTRGFVYSGVKNIIYTMWDVEDKTTCNLMIDFYRGILSGNSYSHSLRNAKINLINNPGTAFPRSWAGYFLLER